MTPPPAHGRRRGGAHARDRRRRKRRARSAQAALDAARCCSRRSSSFPIVVLVAGTVGATAVFGSSCDLKRCGPSPSARTRSSTRRTARELGVIPAERNRTPVARRQISPGCRRRPSRSRTGASTSTAASIRSASPAPSSRTCGPARSSQGGSTITQELVRNLYLSRERTLKRKLIEACLAIKLSRQWSKDRILDRLHEPGLLRQPRVRGRGGRRDVLLETREEAHPRAGRAARRPAAGAVELRPVPQPGRRTRAPERGAARDARERRHHVVGVRSARRRQTTSS